MALVGTCVSFAIYFFWYRFWKNFFYGFLKKTTLNSFDITLITAISGVLNAACTNPIWFINTRMATSKDGKNVFQTVKQVYNEEGLKAFYKGVLPNIMLVSNPIINFVIYEGLKKDRISKGWDMNSPQLFLLSSIAKTFATFGTYPILTVRVKLQDAKNKD